MTKLFDICCTLTRADRELARESNAFDRATITSNGMALALVSTFAFVIWTVFFSSFMNTFAALLLALFCAGFILSIESAFAAYDWQLRGVLRESALPRKWYAAVTLRVAIATILSLFTATGATLALFESAILNEMSRTQSAKNAPLVREFEQRLETRQAQLLQPLVDDVALETAAVAELNDRLRTLREARDQAKAQAQTQFLEANRELEGLNRLKGAGPKHNDARRQQQVYEANAEQAQRELNAVLAEREMRTATLLELKNARQSMVDRLDNERTAGQEKLKNHPDYIPERDGPIMRWNALYSLRNDAEMGRSVNWFFIGASLLLLTFELSFLIVKVVFAPPSVYLVRLITRTKLESLRVTVAYEDAVKELTQQRGGRHLRIVHRTPDPDADANAQAEEQP